MGLFSFFRKNKQESAPDQGEFRSRSAEETSVLRSRTSRAANTTGRGAARGKAGKDGVDPLLPEKKRARRRLIGAVALALAVVIVLPMILDSEPRPLNDDIAIQIPSKDQGANGSASSVAQPVAADHTPVASNAALDQKEEIVEPAAVTSAPAATPPVAAVAPPKPVEKPVVKPEEKKPVAEPREEKKPAKVEPPRKEVKEVREPAKPQAAPTGEDSARALAILEGKPSNASADKKPAATGGKFVIQVAALATQEKINELRNKLSSAGIHSFTQKISTQSGERTRIRVGPFSSRDEAERTGARIKKLGLNATIVPA